MVPSLFFFVFGTRRVSAKALLMTHLAFKTRREDIVVVITFDEILFV